MLYWHWCPTYRQDTDRNGPTKANEHAEAWQQSQRHAPVVLKVVGLEARAGPVVRELGAHFTPAAESVQTTVGQGRRAALGGPGGQPA